MKYPEIIDYISTHKYDPQRARTIFGIVDHVYTSYVESTYLHGVDLSPLFIYFEHLNFHQYIDDKNLSAITKSIFEAYEHDQPSLDAMIASHVSLTTELEKMGRSFFNSSLKTKDTATIQEYFRKHLAVSRRWWHYGILLEDKGRIIQEEVVPRFAKAHGFAIPEAQEVISTLAHTGEPSIFNQERRDFLSLCEYVFVHGLYRTFIEDTDDVLLADLGFKKLFQQYINKYFWIKSDFYKYVPLTTVSLAAEIRNEIQGTTIEEVKARSQKLNDGLTAIKEHRQELERTMHLTASDRKYLYFVTRIIQWIDYRKIGMMTDFYYLTQLLEEISKRLNCSYEQLGGYTFQEIESFLNSTSVPDRALETKRFQGVMTVFEMSNPPALYYDDDGKKLWALLRNQLDTDVVKGIVASRGQGTAVEGVVSIVHDPMQDHFVNGSILVTSMTRVEFIPLMKKAKAIITDEGGIACHAAIVTRELGIPCIIGTKNATRILKNGASVMMDMKSGIVRII